MGSGPGHKSVATDFAPIEPHATLVHRSYFFGLHCFAALAARIIVFVQLNHVHRADTSHRQLQGTNAHHAEKQPRARAQITRALSQQRHRLSNSALRYTAQRLRSAHCWIGDGKTIGCGIGRWKSLQRNNASYFAAVLYTTSTLVLF